jgi:hypothetical protein
VSRFAFFASTGRTATMFIASCLDGLPGVAAFHEGHAPDDRAVRLPPINLHNRKAWEDPAFAAAVTADRRGPEVLADAARAADARAAIDVAFYNAPLLSALLAAHPGAVGAVIFRRCEAFVRSATIVDGEDPQPAGWPDTAKALTRREQFVALGRLRPGRGDPDAAAWDGWTAIQRNIWLWSTVNTHLAGLAAANPAIATARLELLESDPEAFWTGLLAHLGLLDAANLAACVARAGSPVNARTGYQIGPLESWPADDRAFYRTRAAPLEERIYG